MVLESAIEKHLDTRVQLAGGLTVKLNPEGKRGIPDRLVILPKGVVLFVELKRPKGGVIARLQDWWRSRLRSMGHHAHYAKTKGEVDEILAAYGA